MDTQGLIQRIALLSQRFNLESEFSLAAPVLMARALGHPASRPQVVERNVHVIVSDPALDHTVMDLSKPVRVFEAGDEVFDLNANRGWQEILEHLAAKELNQARRDYQHDTSLLSVVAFFSDEPSPCTAPLLDRAKPCLSKLKKALAVRHPRPYAVDPPARLDRFADQAQKSPVQDLDDLDEGLRQVFATRLTELPAPVIAQEISKVTGSVETVVQEVNYQSPWLLVRSHRMAAEYAEPLRRVSIDASGAWGAVEPSFAALDPGFDASAVLVGALRRIALPAADPARDMSRMADWELLRVRLGHAALDQATLAAQRRARPRRV